MTARTTAQGHAATIRDEVSAGANTATRVGTNLRELADNGAFTEDLTEALLRTLAAALTAALGVNGQKITGGAVGTASTDFVIKSQLDAVTAGLALKPALLVATTNLTLSGEQTIDGTLTSGSRVAALGQTSASARGIYLTGAGAWTRVTDMAAGSSASGTLIVVESGTANAGTLWVCTSVPGADVVGTNSLSFVEVDIGAITFAKVATALAAATGAITTNGQTINGRNVATDGTKLDGISANADVTATALAAAGAALANHDVSAIKSATFNGVIDDGNSGAADTIDWGAGQIHKSTLTGACTYTFTAPTGPGTFTLLVYQDATGGRTVVWPAAVIWPSGVAPSLSPGPSAKDKIVFTYDGTNYWGTWGGGAYA